MDNKVKKAQQGYTLRSATAANCNAILLWYTATF